MTLNLSFRRALLADASAIVSLVNSAYRGEASRKGWTTEADLLEGARTDSAEINELISSDGSVFLLAEMAANHDVQATIIGSVHLSKTEDEGECAGSFSMFAINPDSQAGGIGKKMMHEAERFVQHEWGARKMVMEVIPVRHELIAFYERRGYQLTGKVKPFPVNPALWSPKASALQLARMEKRLA